MSDLTFAALWCAGQVALICLLALLVITAVLRRWPELASRTASGAAAVVLGVTLLIPCHLPRWLQPDLADVSQSVQPRESRPVSEPSNVPRSLPDTPASLGFQIHLASLLTKTRESFLVPIEQERRFGYWLPIGLGAGILIGLVRVACGLWALAGLRRRANPITDSNLHMLATSIRKDLHLSQSVALAETHEIGCAAVVGTFQPLILLSHEWRSWSPEEQRAVLAHELAHVGRRDAFWRLVATLGYAIHFYNPLMRWLASRLVLAQELTADRLAMSVAGGQGTYLRSLTGLVLQQDTGTHVRPPLLMMPVFSGHWIRRIEMLRAMDCKSARPTRTGSSWAIVTVLALLALTTTAMRALAQNTEDGAKPTVQTASATDESKPSGAWTSKLFQNMKISANQPIFSDTRALHLDLDAMRRSRWFEPLMNAFIAETLPGIDSKLPDQILDGLRWIICDPNIKLTSNPKAEPGHRNSMAVGASAAIFITNQDVDWKVSLAKYFTVMPKTQGGQDYLEITYPAVGKSSFPVIPIGPRSIAMGLPPTDIKTLQNFIITHDSDHQPYSAHRPYWLGGRPDWLDYWPDWEEDWNQIAGGAVAFATQIPNLSELTSDSENSEGVLMAKQFAEGTDLLLVGMDVDPSEHLWEVKVRVRCAENANAEQVLSRFRELLSLGASQTAQPFLADGLKSAKVQLVDGPRQVIDCQLRFVVPQSVLDAAVNDIHKSKVPQRQQAEKPNSATPR